MHNDGNQICESGFSEPVRPFIRKFFHLPEKKVVELPYLSVHCPEMVDILENVFLRELAEQVVRQTVFSGTELGNESSTWLDIIPPSLRTCEEDIVNYLGMVVAIDFRHWGEKESVTPVPKGGGIVEGEAVEVIPFYCVAQQTSASNGVQKHAETRKTGSGACDSTSNVILLRGSAAMMYLLRRAVEEYHIPWYSPVFLNTFHSVEAAVEALKVCFLGCAIDQVTPMCIPAMKERVELLLSLANALTSKKVSFYSMLQTCGGMLFDASRNGFIDQLQQLHLRYCDMGKLQVFMDTADSNGKVTKRECHRTRFPLLKLAQLTSIAVADGLQGFWRLAEPESTPSRIPSWLNNARCHCNGTQQRKSCTAPFFHDEEHLSICCDYQVPKALRAAGVMRFDPHLTDLVATSNILHAGGEAEVAIRVGSLIGGEMLLHCFQEHFSALCYAFNITLGNEGEKRTVTAQSLDYALWFAGRSLSFMNHHLCRTIMY